MDCTKDDVRASGCFDLNFDQLQNRIFNKYAHHFVLSGEHAFPALIPFVLNIISLHLLLFDSLENDHHKQQVHRRLPTSLRTLSDHYVIKFT